MGQNLIDFVTFSTLKTLRKLLFFSNLVFPEKQVTVEEAYGLCRYNWMREALDSFRNLMTGKPVSSVPELSEPSGFRIAKSLPLTMQ